MTTDVAPTDLPAWARVLVVVAHPDDESFALGALLDRFARAGAAVDVLCLTRGEASTLGAEVPDLAAAREAELAEAAAVLGLASATLLAHPDGGLADLDPTVLEADVVAALEQARPEGVLVFDPRAGVTGHPDHEAASLAALAVAGREGLPVLGWALPADVAATLVEEYPSAGFVGYPAEALRAVPVERGRQLAAVRCHASQAVPGSVMWRRIELLGDTEYLRDLTAG